ncbi:hypothetical protein [Burkholderia ubonensis]|uniref:hypothetical protein n=1 Tax=Burkholderia ubonensis TaxID=101571 RepID=UPI000B133C56|nr:hypothetical protein [Burkholderia ubonensis]
MTTLYHSLDEAFLANPARIADWGYIKCTEADLANLGIEFFDDVEDPGPCRRAAFLGRSGALFVLTIDKHSKTDAAIFSSSERIDGDSDFVAALPEEYGRLVDEFEVVYFGIPT